MQESLDIVIGGLGALNEFNLGNSLVIEKLHERYGIKIPLDELDISPSNMLIQINWNN